MIVVTGGLIVETNDIALALATHDRDGKRYIMIYLRHCEGSPCRVWDEDGSLWSALADAMRPTPPEKYVPLL